MLVFDSGEDKTADLERTAGGYAGNRVAGAWGR